MTTSSSSDLEDQLLPTINNDVMIDEDHHHWHKSRSSPSVLSQVISDGPRSVTRQASQEVLGVVLRTGGAHGVGGRSPLGDRFREWFESGEEPTMFWCWLLPLLMIVILGSATAYMSEFVFSIQALIAGSNPRNSDTEKCQRDVRIWLLVFGSLSLGGVGLRAWCKSSHRSTTTAATTTTTSVEHGINVISSTMGFLGDAAQYVNVGWLIHGLVLVNDKPQQGCDEEQWKSFAFLVQFLFYCWTIVFTALFLAMVTVAAASCRLQPFAATNDVNPSHGTRPHQLSNLHAMALRNPKFLALVETARIDLQGFWDLLKVYCEDPLLCDSIQFVTHRMKMVMALTIVDDGRTFYMDLNGTLPKFHTVPTLTQDLVGEVDIMVVCDTKERFLALLTAKEDGSMAMMSGALTMKGSMQSMLKLQAGLKALTEAWRPSSSMSQNELM